MNERKFSAPSSELTAYRECGDAPSVQQWLLQKVHNLSE